MMSSFIDLQKKLSTIPASVFALGNFDGVHCGHMEIFRQVLNIAIQFKMTPIVLVLFPHPKEIFTGSSPALLTTLSHRMQLIRDAGIQHVECLTFDQKLSNITAQDLLEQFQKHFHMQHLVIGPTTHIGKNRDGTPNRLKEISQTLKFDLTIAKQYELKGCNISSSLIRENILKGEMRWVSDMLGRNYSTQGIVEIGAGKGRTIGFPTANVAQIQNLVPSRGVYAGYGIVDGKKYKAAINIGVRPTMTAEKKLVVECHLIDFEKKIVGQPMTIEWVERLRDEVKFDTIDQLKIQIDRDIRKVKDIL
jgi:riboflavin kinase/FMN adenylyltransferase